MALTTRQRDLIMSAVKQAVEESTTQIHESINKHLEGTGFNCDNKEWDLIMDLACKDFGFLWQHYHYHNGGEK